MKNLPNMTYNQLLECLLNLSPDELQMNVSIYSDDMDEYLPVSHFDKTSESVSVLDEGHPIIVMND